MAREIFCVGNRFQKVNNHFDVFHRDDIPQGTEQSDIAGKSSLLSRLSFVFVGKNHGLDRCSDLTGRRNKVGFNRQKFIAESCGTFGENRDSFAVAKRTANVIVDAQNRTLT